MPLFVTAPPAVTLRSPVNVNAFRSSVSLSLIVTAAMVPDKGVNVTVLEKVLDWFRVIPAHCLL